jgi:hypothetical protein
VPQNPESQAQNPLPEESGRPSHSWKEALSRDEFASIGLAHTGVDARHQKQSACPSRVGSNQHVLRRRHLAWEDEQSRRPPNLDEGKSRSAPQTESIEFCADGSSGSQSGLRYRINLASGFLSIVDAPPTAKSHAARSDGSSRERPVIVASAGPRKIGNVACLRRTTSLRPLKPESNPAGSYPSLTLVAFRGAES